MHAERGRTAHSPTCLIPVTADILRISATGHTVITEIKKWGNSQGLRISRELLAQLHMEVGDRVDVAVQDGTLVISPARRVRGGHDLHDLVRRIPKGSKPKEVDWGPPVGREEW